MQVPQLHFWDVELTSLRCHKNYCTLWCFLAIIQRYVIMEPVWSICLELMKSGWLCWEWNVNKLQSRVPTKQRILWRNSTSVRWHFCATFLPPNWDAGVTIQGNCFLLKICSIKTKSQTNACVSTGRAKSEYHSIIKLGKSIKKLDWSKSIFQGSFC